MTNIVQGTCRHCNKPVLYHKHLSYRSSADTASLVGVEIGGAESADEHVDRPGLPWHRTCYREQQAYSANRENFPWVAKYALPA